MIGKVFMAVFLNLVFTPLIGIPYVMRQIRETRVRRELQRMREFDAGLGSILR